MSSGGSLPSGTKIGEGGYHGETYGAELADLAYKGFGGIVPLHSRAFSTASSTCFVLCDFNGCCKEFHFISGATQQQHQNGACGSHRGGHGKESFGSGAGGDVGGGVGGDDFAAFGDGVGEIWRGIFVVCCFSDNTFAVLVVRAPTGKFTAIAQSTKLSTGIFRCYR